MSNFKIGDKVRCIDDSCVICLAALDFGKDYTVQYVDSDLVYLNGGWYASERFVLSETHQKPVDLPKYVIVQGKAEDVVAEVEQYLKQGYKPQGGVSMHQNWFAQALVLNEPC